MFLSRVNCDLTIATIDCKYFQDGDDDNRGRTNTSPWGAVPSKPDQMSKIGMISRSIFCDPSGKLDGFF